MSARAGRLVAAPLLGLAALGVAALPFLRHARNRLLSGTPVGIVEALGAGGPAPVGAATLGMLLIGAMLWRPGSERARAGGLVGIGILVAAAAGLAGQVASHLATAASPAARTSLGAGWWVLVCLLLLLATDVWRRLRPGPWRWLALAGAAAPLAAVIALGGLDQLALLREFAAQRGALAAAVQRHVLLVVCALLPSVLIGVPLGVAAQRRPGLRRVAFPLLNLVQTVPSIALFGLLIAPLSALGAGPLGRLGIGGVGLAPALLALLLYALLPIVRNTVDGLDAVPASVRDAASGMGMTMRQVFWRVELKLALPVLLSGVRVTAVQAVGLAAVSALIGAGGLGAIIFQGLFANALDLVVLGALPVIALAAGVDAGFRALTLAARRAAGSSA